MFVAVFDIFFVLTLSINEETALLNHEDPQSRRNLVIKWNMIWLLLSFSELLWFLHQKIKVSHKLPTVKCSRHLYNEKTFVV